MPDCGWHSIEIVQIRSLTSAEGHDDAITSSSFLFVERRTTIVTQSRKATSLKVKAPDPRLGFPPAYARNEVKRAQFGMMKWDLEKLLTREVCQQTLQHDLEGRTSRFSGPGLLIVHCRHARKPGSVATDGYPPSGLPVSALNSRYDNRSQNIANKK